MVSGSKNHKELFRAGKATKSNHKAPINEGDSATENHKRCIVQYSSSGDQLGNFTIKYMFPNTYRILTCLE